MDQQTHDIIVKPKRKIRLFCNECNKKRYRLDKSHEICHVCYKAKTSILCRECNKKRYRLDESHHICHVCYYKVNQLISCSECNNYRYRLDESHEICHVCYKAKTSILCRECNNKRYRLDESHEICHICYKAKTLILCGKCNNYRYRLDESHEICHVCYKAKTSILCSKCNNRRYRLDESHEICHVCYKAKTLILCGKCNNYRYRLDESHEICHICYKAKTSILCSKCNNRRYRLDESHEICHVCYKAKTSILCRECNNKRYRLDESHEICHVCYKAKTSILCSECYNYRYRLDESHEICHVCYKAKTSILCRECNNKRYRLDESHEICHVCYKAKTSILCRECNNRRYRLDESHEICHVCYKAKTSILCRECNNKRYCLDESHKICHVCYKAKTSILCRECNNKRYRLDESHEICHVCYKAKTSILCSKCNNRRYCLDESHEICHVCYKAKTSILCSECNNKRYRLDESHEICHVCYKAKTSRFKLSKQSGNKVIDDFIKYTFFNTAKIAGKSSTILFIPNNQFKNVEFIAERGFSKIYKAIWINGPSHWDYKKECYEYNQQNYAVVLKKLNNSKNVTSKELNELKIFYEYSKTTIHNNTYRYVSEYYGITQDPITQDIMIIMPYYDNGDLINYFKTNDFYHISWGYKLSSLQKITLGLNNIHEVNIVHRDLHSGNIFFSNSYSHSVVIGDLGISKSATESTDDNNNNNENYGIIPYMAPEIFHGQKYTTALDIYSFGMIMWEFMTGRRPFWDKIHNAELIIEICDGLRPPIVTNAPEGYIDLMKECWHSDPGKRPSASNIYNEIGKMRINHGNNHTKIIKSPDIGPIAMNNPGAIYKSRPLSGMIQSAMSTRSLRSQSINLETDLFHCYQKSHTFFYDKRKFEDDQIENSLINGKSIKKMKLIENENNVEYTTQEIDFDIDTF